MSQRGRKTKYTPDTLDRLRRALELGAPQKMACAAAGIGHTTFHEWMNTRPEFRELVQNAEAVAAVGWLAVIEQAAQSGTWQAAAWKLERRYPQDFGRRIEQTVNVNSREVAEQLADAIGVDPREVIAEAEALLRSSQDR